MEPAVLIYDGDCAGCRASALWLMRRALLVGMLDILPWRSGPRRERFPGVSERACMTAMQLVLPDGRVLSGAAAVPEILRRVRGFRWLASTVGLPPVGPLSRWIYGWVADRRMRLRCRHRTV